MKTLPIHRQVRTRDGSTASAPEIKGSPCSPCQQGDDSQGEGGAKRTRSELTLPEDILYQIHALMPVRAAARAACVSRAFLHSWRCYPRLILDIRTLGINEGASEEDDEMTRDFISRVDHVMQNHSAIGVKTFKLQTYPCYNLHPSCVDRWLQVAITSGIKEFELQMEECSEIEYNFPCSLLSSERASSIQSFTLAGCSFHSVVEVGCLSSLTSVYLRAVHITGEELCRFLSNSLALEQLELGECNDIVCLSIPCLLSQLNFLQVYACSMLEMIEANAPKLSYFNYVGRPIHISLGESLQVRKVQMLSVYESNMLYYARTKLPSIAPNLQTLFLSSHDETVNTPMALGKFFHLKCLEIVLVTPSCSPDYDFYSLVSFLDASPVLETFILRIDHPAIRHDSILEDSNGDSSHQRRFSEHRHNNLKNMMITGFCSAKSMIELIIHILERTSLECLTLDTTRGYDRRFNKIDKCLRMCEEAFMEARKARLAITRYVDGKVPSTVKLNVIEPCSKCY